MRRRLTLATIGLCFALGMAAQKKSHIVQPGETLYGIARKYGVTATSILAQNPKLADGNHIEVGQVLVLPSNANVTPTTEPAMPVTGATQQGAAQPVANAGSYSIPVVARTEPQQPKGYLGSGCKEMYLIKKKDNLYRIALEYGLTIEEIVAANPELTPDSKLKKGEFLCIPFSKAELEAMKAAQVQQQQTVVAQQQPVNDLRQTTTKQKRSRMDHINMGVVLPVKEGGELGSKMLEFYRGLLMAADSVKSQGVTVEVFAYHSGTNVDDMNFLLQKPALKKMDIIFGPLHREQAPTLSNFCKENEIRLVMPFSTTNNAGSDNPYVYQAGANSEAVRKSAADMVTGRFAGANFIILQTGQADDRGNQFTAEMKKQLKGRGVAVRTMTLGDEASYEAALNSFCDNIIIPDASALSCTQTLCKQLHNYTQNHPEFKVSLIGYPEWPTYNASTIAHYYALDTYAYSTFYRNAADYQTQRVEQSYKKAFRTEMGHYYPRYGLFGLDLGYFFLHGLAVKGDYFDEQQSGLHYTPCQSAFNFEQSAPNAAHKNQQVMLVHYKTNQQVEVIK
ncbi:MAG: LysM peptidoglycan-binding domain-containing protein [Bacteroidales bacterium]|nr:LysM peptidoglycan-binding domain-containing protein [Candidatus Physcousia equi]